MSTKRRKRPEPAPTATAPNRRGRWIVALFCALALSGRRFGPLFWALTVVAVAINAFGALTFDRPEYARFYYMQPSQVTLFQPD